jgi:hypothetical protein
MAKDHDDELPPGNAFKHIAHSAALDPGGVFASMQSICDAGSPKAAADALRTIVPYAAAAAANLRRACAESATTLPRKPGSGCAPA